MSTYGPTFLTESPQVSLSIEKNYKLNRYVALYVHTYCSKKVSTKSRPSNLQQPKHLLRVDLASPTYAPFIVGLDQWSVNQYLGIGKYLFILQISIMYRFMENSLISILMLSIKKYILIYWYFQYFPVPFLKSLESFISRVFMEFNTPKSSSAHSERLFSGGKLFLETKCNSLGDENFEKLLLLSF